MTIATIGSEVAELVEQTRRPFERLMACKIASGAPTTWDYRRWCREHGVSPTHGVFRMGHPDPLPMTDPVQCLACNAIMERREWADEQHIVVAAIRFGNPDNAEPAEYEQFCPECGASTSFDELAKCTFCGCWPCCCPEDESA